MATGPTERVTVRMMRGDPSTNWGFRIQGGQEYAAPLLIAKVHEGGLADRAGLLEGDQVLVISGRNVAGLACQAAEDFVVHSGNNLDVVVERPTTRIWRPEVTPVNVPPGDMTAAPVKYSLAHDRAPTEYSTIGSAHNVQPRPFGQPQGGGGGQQQQQRYSSSSSTKITEQYPPSNQPPPLSSRKTAVDEYLEKTGGLFGTDPKLTQQKLEPSYLKSETLRLIKESETRTTSGGSGGQQDSVTGLKGTRLPPPRVIPKEPPPAPPTVVVAAAPNTEPKQQPTGAPPSYQSKSFLRLTQALSVDGKEPDGGDGDDKEKEESTPVLAPSTDGARAPTAGAPLCDHCGRSVYGVFCKVGGKTLHAECFKCATCGSMLKNVGYVMVNDKLYCDVHARQQREQSAAGGGHHHHAPGSRIIPVHHQQTGGGTDPNGNNYASSYQYQKKTTKTTTSSTSNQQGQQQQQQPYTISVTKSPAAPVPMVVAPPPANAAGPRPSQPPPPPPPAPTGPPPANQQTDGYSSNYKDRSPTPITNPKEDEGSYYAAPIVVSTSADEKTKEPTEPSGENGLKSLQWPPAPSVDREKTVKPWRPPVKLSKDFGPGAHGSSMDDDEDRRLLSYRPIGFRRVHASDIRAVSEAAYAIGVVGKGGGSETKEPTNSSREEPIVEREDRMANENISAPIQNGNTTTNDEERLRPTTQNGHQSPECPLRSSTADPNREPQTSEEPTSDMANPNSILFKLNNYAIDRGIAEGSTTPGGGSAERAAVQGGESPKKEFDPTATTESTWSTGGVGGKAPARRGRGILKQVHDTPRIPVCESCNREIRGPFVLALGKSWCPDHFVCASSGCRRPLLDIGFIEENGMIYCEFCYEKYFAPNCSKCSRPIVGDCLTALDRQWHPDCFVCGHCRKPFGSTSFFVENGQAYCEQDWNQLFTTKCFACHFPIEAGDRWVEALNNAYHADCFSCAVCQKNLEGQSFYAKANRPYCKEHA